MSTTLRWLRRLVYLLVGLLLGTQLLLAGAAVYIEHTNHKMLEIIGGSMEPLYSVGDAVILDLDKSALKPGEVITFHSGPQKLTTHRIVAEKRIRGELFFQTKGDANKTPDPDFAPAAAVLGRPVFHVPHGGIVSSYLQSRTGRLLTFGPALLLVAIAELAHVRRSWNDDEPPEPPEGPEAPEDVAGGDVPEQKSETTSTLDHPEVTADTTTTSPAGT